MKMMTEDLRHAEYKMPVAVTGIRPIHKYVGTGISPRPGSFMPRFHHEKPTGHFPEPGHSRYMQHCRITGSFHRPERRYSLQYPPRMTASY
jgi:hypothetical protein